MPSRPPISVSISMNLDSLQGCSCLLMVWLVPWSEAEGDSETTLLHCRALPAQMHDLWMWGVAIGKGDVSYNIQYCSPRTSTAEHSGCQGKCDIMYSCKPAPLCISEVHFDRRHRTARYVSLSIEFEHKIMLTWYIFGQRQAVSRRTGLSLAVFAASIRASLCRLWTFKNCSSRFYCVVEPTHSVRVSMNI